MKTILFSLLAVASLSATAQHGSKSNYIPMVTHGIGASFQKFEGLNSRIANYPQFKPLKESAGTLQLGFLKERNRLISDMGLIAGSSMSGDRDKKSSTIRFLGVKHVVPMHYATFPVLTGTPEKLRDETRDIPGITIHALKPGDSL